ncbi:unnamed protein product [Anisakis simplex]|uniref:Uncharacterized protein n=1 Tax=Anisakis simplex TaxID=6269 RepID=A0A0M3K727_ANISI|nr:unnamed protein product [Anisakis simplex]
MDERSRDKGQRGPVEEESKEADGRMDRRNESKERIGGTDRKNRWKNGRTSDGIDADRKQRRIRNLNKSPQLMTMARTRSDTSSSIFRGEI